MKSTKIMVAVIAAFLITWTVIGLIGYLLSDGTYKECMTKEGTLIFMLIFGWIPSVILGIDLRDRL